MRKIGFICAVLVGIAFFSCDKVDNPYINKGGNAVIPTVKPTRVDSTSRSDDDTVKILVEDYTAHHCTECPSGSAQCETFVNAYPTHSVFMEINTAILANSYPTGTFGSGVLDSAYFFDYRTLSGDNWNNTFINGDVNGMPGIMVDRIPYYGYFDLVLSGTAPSQPGDSIVAAHSAQSVNIHIVDSMYAPPTSTLSMSITTTLKAPVAGTKYFLVVALVEDSIFDWQDSSNHNVQFYLKRMTLRTTINDGNSGWGDSLISTTTAPQTQHYVYVNPQNLFRYNGAPFKTSGSPYWVQPDDWNMAHMYIVAFVYQTGVTHNDMVLQAQKLHL